MEVHFCTDLLWVSLLSFSFFVAIVLGQYNCCPCFTAVLRGWIQNSTCRITLFTNVCATFAVYSDVTLFWSCIRVMVFDIDDVLERFKCTRAWVQGMQVLAFRCLWRTLPSSLHMSNGALWWYGGLWLSASPWACPSCLIASLLIWQYATSHILVFFRGRIFCTERWQFVANTNFGTA